MTHPPQTMTTLGLGFLQALAAQSRGGAFLEIGPLFGSSTCAIARGRRVCAPLHTIDTFAPAPWVRKRFGIDLDRALFDRFTAGISDLHVHQGLAPEVVRDSWDSPIGFYFDDATHGDPGWSANWSFFRPFFRRDAILCGDDFAGGWPDVVTNVSRIAAAEGMRLFVMGRVWAMTAADDARILAAIDSLCPGLAGAEIEVDHGAGTRALPAAVWSYGLHGTAPLRTARIRPHPALDGQITLTDRNGRQMQAPLAGARMSFDNLASIGLRGPRGLGLQLCLIDAQGRTQNTRAIPAGHSFRLPPSARVAALRLAQ